MALNCINSAEGEDIGMLSLKYISLADTGIIRLPNLVLSKSTKSPANVQVLIFTPVLWW